MIVILGAGIAGLTYASQLKKAGKPFTLLEDSSRAGGSIRSEHIDGFLLEYGPNTVLPSAELIRLIESVGLGPKVELAKPTCPRYIQFQKRLYRLPMNPFALLSTGLLSLSGKYRLFSEPFVRSQSPTHDETLSDFARRRLGDEVTERLLAPFVSGVWAGDIHALSAKASFPKLVAWEKEHGSLFKGMLKKKKGPPLPKGLLSFENGLESLPQAIAQQIGSDLHLNERVTRIDHNTVTKKWTIITQRGVYHADQLVSSLPAYQMADLVNPWAPSLARALSSIPYVALTVAHLSARKASIGNELNGFGYLVAPSENAPVLGCLWNSSLFPRRAPQDQALLTIFIKGTADQTALDRAIEAVAKTLEASEGFKTLSVRHYENAIPQYTLGHTDRMSLIHQAEKEWPGLLFIGNYLEGISVGDVVRQSFQKSV